MTSAIAELFTVLLWNASFQKVMEACILEKRGPRIFLWGNGPADAKGKHVADATLHGGKGWNSVSYPRKESHDVQDNDGCSLFGWLLRGASRRWRAYRTGY